MTPYESIKFVADLKFKGSEREKEEFIEEIIEDFKLGECRDTLIGGEDVKGISGGERKRTSIALELIKQPDVLMLDEPTSGLDSFTSYIIVHILKQYVKKHNTTVVMTIHQPNQEVFDLFDTLTLMLEGTIVYQHQSHLIT